VAVTTAHEALARVAAGLSVDPARLDERGRRAMAHAGALGAPVSEALAVLEARAVADADAERALRRATAQGRSVAVGLALAPPVLAPLLGVLLGTGVRAPLPVLVVAGLLWCTGVVTVRVLVGRAGRPRPAGRRAVALPVGLLLAGVVAVVFGPVAGGVVAVLAVALRVEPRDAPPGLAELLDLTALGLRVGLGAGPALRHAGSRLPALTDVAARVALWLELGAPGPPPALPGVAGLLALAVQEGRPVLPVVVRAADELRADELQQRLEAAERLPVQLTVPTTLLLLPAALLVVLAPVVTGLLDVLR
jgi:tight adherence protein C